MIRPAAEADSPAIPAILPPILRDTLATFSGNDRSRADLPALLAAGRAAMGPAANPAGVAFRAAVGFALAARLRAVSFGADLILMRKHL